MDGPLHSRSYSVVMVSPHKGSAWGKFLPLMRQQQSRLKYNTVHMLGRERVGLLAQLGDQRATGSLCHWTLCYIKPFYQAREM